MSGTANSRRRCAATHDALLILCLAGFATAMPAERRHEVTGKLRFVVTASLSGGAIYFGPQRQPAPSQKGQR
jgi:hypothetical protein